MSGIKYTGGWFGSGGLIGGSYAPTKAGYFMKNPFVNRPTYFQPGEEGYVFRALSEEEANINGGRKLKQVLRDDPNITLREAEVKVRADWVDSWVNAAGEPPVKVYPNSKFTISKWLDSGGVGEVEFAGTLKRQLKDFRSSQSDKAFSQGDYDKATEWNNTKFQDIVDLHSDSLQTFNQENYGGMQDARWSLQENYALQNLTKVETPGIEMTDIDPMADPKYTHGMDWDLYEKVKTKEEQVRDYDEGWEEREFKKVIEQDTKDWLERGKQATYRGTKTEWLQPQPAIEEPYGEFEDDEAWEKSGLEKNSRSAQLLEDLEDKYGEWWEDHSEFNQKALDDIHEFDMEHGQFGDLESISHIDDPSRFETFDDLIDYVENKYGKNWYSNNEAQIEIGEWEHPQSGASGYLKDLRQQTFMTDIPQAGFEADLGDLGQDVMQEFTLEQLLAADEIPISYVAAMRASALSRGAQKFWSPLQRKIDAFAESTNNLYGDLRDLSQHRDLGLGAHEYEVGGDDPMAILDYARTSLAEQRQAIQKAQSKHWYNEQKAEFEKVLGQIEELKLQGLELSTEYQVQTADLHRWVKNAEEFMQSGAIPQEDTAAFRSMLEEANQHSSQNWAEPENTNLLLEHTGLDGQLLDFQMEHGIMNERWTSGFWQGRNVPGDENVDDAKYGEEEADELRDWVDAEGKPYYTFDADGNPITFDGKPLEPKTDFVDDTRAELESWVDADGKPYYTFDADGNPITFDGEPIFPKTDFVSEPHYRHREIAPGDFEGPDAPGTDFVGDDFYAEPLVNDPLQMAFGEDFIGNAAGLPQNMVEAMEARGLEMGLGADVIFGFQQLAAGELGKGGDLGDLQAAEQAAQSRSSAYDARHLEDGYWDRRDQRQTRLNDDFIDQEVYINIGNLWYKGTVHNTFLGNFDDPQTRFGVTIGWEDPDGKTVDRIVPATTERIRLTSDGPVPPREGGVTLFEPWTNPEDAVRQKRITDIGATTIPGDPAMEQVKIGDRWYEVREITAVSPGHWLVKATDGTLIPYPAEGEKGSNTITWRARGRTHTDKYPKTPKYDPRKWYPDKKLNLKATLQQRLDKISADDADRTDIVQSSLSDAKAADRSFREFGGGDLWDLNKIRATYDLPPLTLAEYAKFYPEEAKKEGYVDADQDGDIDSDDQLLQAIESTPAWDPNTTPEDLLEWDLTPEEKAQLAVEHWGGEYDDWLPGFSGDTADGEGDTADGEGDDVADWLATYGKDEDWADTNVIDTFEGDEGDDDTFEGDEGDDDTFEGDEGTDDTFEGDEGTDTGTGLAQTGTHTDTGHTQDHPPTGGIITAEVLKYIVDTQGFEGLETKMGLSMETIYEKYALGEFPMWQHSKTIPDWLQPNLTNIYGGSDKYKDLINKYENDPEMSQYLERVGTAVRAPDVITYFNRTHNEMKSLWHNGSLDADKIENITEGNMPGFAYNSAGHVILSNDTTIDHGFNHDRKIVHYYNPQGEEFEHHQMDFAKKAGEQPIHSAASLQETRSTDYGNPAEIINTQQTDPGA